MRILHIVPSYRPAYQYGGTIVCVAKLCEGLVKFGEDVTVFTTTANGKQELNVEEGVEHIIEGVKVFYFKRITKDHSHISPSLWKRLYKECNKYDRIHIHSWWNPLVLVSAFICKKKKIKPVLSSHGMLSRYIIHHSNSIIKTLTHHLIGKSLIKNSILHTTSEAELKECEQLIPGLKGFVISNIVWLPELNIQTRNNSVFTIVFLSRIHPKKGLELLIETISKLKTQVHLLVVGTGEKKYVEGLKQKAQILNVNNKIEWLGWKDGSEKFKILMQADLFALISHNENFANVVVESLHVGTPVLLSKEVGLSEFVADKDLGWICDLQPNDVAEKIETAINSPKKHKRINQCASSIVKDSFSPENLIPQYLQLYQFNSC